MICSFMSWIDSHASTNKVLMTEISILVIIIWFEIFSSRVCSRYTRFSSCDMSGDIARFLLVTVPLQ